MADEWQVLDESRDRGVLSQKLGRNGRYAWHIAVRDDGTSFRVLRYTGASYGQADEIPSSLLPHIFRLVHRMKQIPVLTGYREHSPFKEGSVLKLVDEPNMNVLRARVGGEMGDNPNLGSYYDANFVLILSTSSLWVVDEYVQALEENRSANGGERLLRQQMGSTFTENQITLTIVDMIRERRGD